MIFLFVFSEGLFAQTNLTTFDERTYDMYLKGDYKNLKITVDTMLSIGIDYYYLRMRIGILSFNRQHYSSAYQHFHKAGELNTNDSISREYIYRSYLFSGRYADASLYLKSLHDINKMRNLKQQSHSFFSNVFAGTNLTGYEMILPYTNSFFYEAVKRSVSINTGFDINFSDRLKGTIAYSNFHKTGTYYSSTNSSGSDLDFSQDQFYLDLSTYIFPGWMISAFSHMAFYSDISLEESNISSVGIKKYSEYLFGAGVNNSGWKIRTGANISFSNFAGSSQLRGESYITWLPFSNLNFYTTTGGMCQYDKDWGNTYQFNQEVGFKVLKFLWMEQGIIIGDSFLYGRSGGYFINNSFHIPALTVYNNIIVLTGRDIKFTVTPVFTKYDDYSWDMDSHSRSSKTTVNSFGCSLKITYKSK